MKFLKAIVAALIMTSAAHAADLPSSKPKLANPFSEPYDLSKCGMYFGINSTITSTGVNGSGVAPGSNIAQGAIGGTLGYGCPISATNQSFWFVEAMADVTNLNGSTQGISLSGPASFTERFGFGTPLNQMVGALFPNAQSPAVPNLPTLPGGVTAGPGAPYLFAALHENDISAQLGLAQNREWLISYGVGVGLRYRLSNAVVADTFAEYRTQSNSICVGPLGNSACAKIGSGVVAGVQFLY